MIQDGLKQENGIISSFLMIGQSNMAGRGELSDVPPIDNPDCFMLRMGRWQRLCEPVNPDRGIFEGEFHSGISMGSSFADEASRLLGKVGMIPCADGGTRLDQWMPGEILYDHAVMMTGLAVRSSRLRAILWHQGESDCTSEAGVQEYGEKFIRMMTSLRKDLGQPDLPVVIGELSENITGRWGVEDRPVRLNGILRDIAGELSHCSIVSVKGLTLKPDGIHFDAASQRELGRRYFDAYCALTGMERR
ncbi:MAG: sialate O-acetylesterase [Oscillospiraceae bacterium]|nr:sialate O-acetylesterase [Oscillospiraceae bacterium]